MSDPLRTELLRILKERWDCDTPEQALAAYPADSSAARTARVLLDAGSQQAWQNGTLCPDAPVCESCPCAEEDDACFPGDRLRAERDLYRDTLHDLTSMRKAHS